MVDTPIAHASPSRCNGARGVADLDPGVIRKDCLRIQCKTSHPTFVVFVLGWSVHMRIGRDIPDSKETADQRIPQNCLQSVLSGRRTVWMHRQLGSLAPGLRSAPGAGSCEVDVDRNTGERVGWTTARCLWLRSGVCR